MIVAECMMDVDKYFIPAGPAEAELRVVNSRFIAIPPLRQKAASFTTSYC